MRREKAIKNIRNRGIEAPETARGKLDFECGDIVQIRTNSPKYAGRVGVIIGVRYKKLEKAGEMLSYSVRFSDSEAADFVANHMKYIRHADSTEI